MYAALFKCYCSHYATQWQYCVFSRKLQFDKLHLAGTTSDQWRTLGLYFGIIRKGLIRLTQPVRRALGVWAPRDLTMEKSHTAILGGVPTHTMSRIMEAGRIVSVAGLLKYSFRSNLAWRRAVPDSLEHNTVTQLLFSQACAVPVCGILCV